MRHLDASALQEVLADVAAVVFNRVLVDELLAHDRPLLLKAGHFSFLLHTKATKGNKWAIVWWLKK